MTGTRHLDHISRVHSNEKVMTNMLNFAEVEDMFKITYLLGEGFIVHLHDKDILFACIGKLYVTKWDDAMNEASSYVTIQEMESMYMKADVKRAKQAYQLPSASGYPSISELIYLMEDGNISRIPGITCVDIKRAYELYGEHVAYVC